MKSSTKSTNSNNLYNSDNSNSNINISDGNKININKLIDDLENIGNEKNKEEFIKNYSKIKEQLKIVDTILFNTHNNKNDNESDNESDNNNEINNEYESKNISELLSVLETNEDKIFNSSNLNVGELKTLMKICNVLEKKINNETMNIIEIK